MAKHPVNGYVCESVRRLRTAKRISVQEMAERTGIALGSYSCLETGRYRMSLDLLFAIISVLGAEIADVWPGTLEKPCGRLRRSEIGRFVEEASRMRPKRTGINEILAVVCRHLKIRRKDLLSASRKRELAQARAIHPCCARRLLI